LRHRPDVILGHNIEGGLVAGLASRVLRVPAVYVRHSAFAEELGLVTGHAALGGELGAWGERAVRRLAHTTVELAPHTGNGHRSGVTVIAPPADLEERRVDPGDGLTLYYEGNLDSYQNPGWLEGALAAARRLDPGVRLRLASRPSERPPFADLALAPRSLPGGFPMKLLAYQMAGIPAVCVESAAPGLVDGEDAFVVPGRGSPQAFATRVVEALADKAGRERDGSPKGPPVYFLTHPFPRRYGCISVFEEREPCDCPSSWKLWCIGIVRCGCWGYAGRVHSSPPN
jgi:hypothetical protein